MKIKTHKSKAKNTTIAPLILTIIAITSLGCGEDFSIDFKLNQLNLKTHEISCLKKSLNLKTSPQKELKNVRTPEGKTLYFEFTRIYESNPNSSIIFTIFWRKESLTKKFYNSETISEFQSKLQHYTNSLKKCDIDTSKITCTTTNNINRIGYDFCDKIIKKNTLKK